MRIGIGQLAHETNTFSNIKTTVDCFKQLEWEYGEGIIKKNRGVRDFLGGMIDRGDELGIEIVPTFSTCASPSGTITKETYHTAKQELLSGFESAGRLDAICSGFTWRGNC
jgi:microcystin degradation protein MlrC